MDGFYIDDNFTRTRTLDGAAGLYPKVAVAFRPALAQKRLTYQRELAGGTPEKVTAFENKLIAEAKVTLNGDAVPEDKAGRLVPALRQRVIDLILGYEGADSSPEDDLKK